MVAVAMSIAGSDPSGGAGIQADLKTFHQHGVYGMAAITLLTVQSTRGVEHVEVMRPELVRAQIEVAARDIPPAAVKTGALGTREVVEVVAECVRNLSFLTVVDPVMISKHGAPLIDEHAQRALRDRLLPLCALVTPNAPEAAALSGRAVLDLAGAREAARAILDLGARAVLVKGGHLEGALAVDVLADAGGVHEIAAPRVATGRTHGTGCTLSAAITARLARGEPLHQAVRGAKAYLTAALRSAPALGGGIGPVDHFARETDA